MWIEIRDEAFGERAYFNPDAVTSVAVEEDDLLYYVRIADTSGNTFYTASFLDVKEAAECAGVIVGALEAGARGISIVIGKDRKTSVARR